MATIPVQPGIKYTWSVEAKALINGCPFYSYPEVRKLDYAIASCGGSGVQFSGKVFLQGAYNPATGTMNNDLNTLGILQAKATSQPYNHTAFFYTGTEKVDSGFYAAHSAVVDWVLLELRDPNSPSSVVARRAAFVTQDGTIMDTSGSASQIFFPNVAPGPYTVSVRHRNHLGIRSTTPVDFTTGSATYDFTTANYQSFQNQPYPSPVQAGTVWCMRGGNANANGNTKYSGPGSDQNQILNTKLGGSLSLILSNVYAPEDLNMNGSIKWSGPGSDQNFLLNAVLLGSLSAVKTVNTNCKVKSSVLIYPTLSRGEVTVKLPPGYEEARIQVLGSTCAVVLSDESKSFFRLLNIRKLANGIYLVQVVNQNRVTDKAKIVLQR